MSDFAICFYQVAENCRYEWLAKVNVFLISELESTEPEIEQLCSLQRYPKGFALAVYQRRYIYLAGGSKCSQVSFFDTKKNTWSDAPSLNIERYQSAAIALENYLYVTGGSSRDWSGDRYSSIERLDLSRAEAEWSIVLQHNSLVQRNLPAIVVVSTYQIAVFGGENGRVLNDGYIFDTNKLSVRRIMGK